MVNRYDPSIHHRRSIRLKEYDYSEDGAYYITLCTQNRECLFGDIENGIIRLSEYGEIAGKEWDDLEKRFHPTTFNVFQIMPNHIHAIITIINVGATLAVAQNAVDLDSAVAQNMVDADTRSGASPAPTVGDIVGAYKSLVYKRCLDLCKSKNATLGKLWQRNYYEHIIRNDIDYINIAEYITNNPKTWENDKLWIK